MRLIDADKTIEHIKTRLHETALNNATVNCDASYLYIECADNRIKTWVDEIPTVDAEPILHGEWLMDDDSGDIKCSCCGHWSFDMYDETFVIDGHKGIATIMPHYCGYCGAKMDEEEVQI